MSTTKAAQLKTVTQCMDELRARLDAINIAVDTAPSLEKAQEWVNREAGHARAYLKRADTLLGVDTRPALPPPPAAAKSETPTASPRRRAPKRKSSATNDPAANGE